MTDALRALTDAKGATDTFVAGLNQALKHEMKMDPSVIVLGEDIARLGGLFRVTEGLMESFPGRVLDTPISENGLAGLGVGAAIAGQKVVVEFQVLDFIWLAADQVVNSGLMHFVSGGQVSVPVVFRGPCGFGTGFGVTHTQHLETVFAGRPGLKVVMPSTPWDAKALLTSAIRDPNPVIFIEESTLYYKQGAVPQDGVSVPLGSARVVSRGDDITLISAGRGISICERAVQMMREEGVSAELIDLRTLKPVDWNTLRTSVSKTGRAICAIDGSDFCSFATYVTANLTELCWDDLQAAPSAVTGEDVACAVAAEAESVAGIDESMITTAALGLMGRGRKSESSVSSPANNKQRKAGSSMHATGGKL